MLRYNACKSRFARLLVLYVFLTLLSGAFAAPGVALAQGQPREVVVAAIVSLTGTNAAWGQMTWRGIELAAELINEQGGIKSLGGAPIRVIAADTESNPVVAGIAAERVIQQGAIALIGTNQSAATLVVTQVAERNQVPFITSTDVEPLITERGFRYTFRTSPLVNAYGRDILTWVKEQGERTGIVARKVAFISENSVVGQSSVQFGRQAAEELGFEVVDAVTYDAASTQNFTSYLARFRAAGAEVILGHNKPSDAILITRTLKELNYNPMVYGGMLGGHISREYVSALGADANYVIATTSWSPNVQIEGMDEIKARFREKYGVDMDSTAAAGITSMAVIWEALEQSGTRDPRRLRDAIANVELRTGERMYLQLSGVKFDERGENLRASGVVFMIKDENWIPIAPTQFAAAEAPWPKPAWGSK